MADSRNRAAVIDERVRIQREEGSKFQFFSKEVGSKARLSAHFVSGCVEIINFFSVNHEQRVKNK